ncbi:MAG: ABC transporter substrate-binding protein [Pontibacterium sp.]
MTTYLPRRLRSGLGASVLAIFSFTAAAADKQAVDISYLEFVPERAPVLSNILPDPEDTGLAGANLGIKDSNTTGRFLGQTYTLHPEVSDDLTELTKQASAQYAEGLRLFVVNAPADALVSITEALPTDALVFNAGSYANHLRTDTCYSNMLHTLPSRAMLTDALGQWSGAKRWKDWLVIRGDTPQDKAYSASLDRTAKRFGINIIETKVWNFDTDLRRTAQKELPVFTQTDEYDLVVTADERGDFGEYVPYNTWYPRPVAGTQGLTPTGWHRVVEQWGAAQLQSRFDKQSKRWMNSKDYASWAAVRSIAEAVTRTKDTSPSGVKSYLLSDKFELAAFKGRKLSYRTWSGQLRQPIPLVHPRALVSQAPLEGYLHPKTELDTLGFDEPESQCTKL